MLSVPLNENIWMRNNYKSVKTKTETDSYFKKKILTRKSTFWRLYLNCNKKNWSLKKKILKLMFFCQKQKREILKRQNRQTNISHSNGENFENTEITKITKTLKL